MVFWLAASPCFTKNLLRYFISDRRLCGGLPSLLEMISRQMALGVEYIQIREKDLSAGELFEFVSAVVARRDGSRSKILVNDRADVAVAAGADGVHLPSHSPIVTLPGLIVARSCHTEEEVRAAKADFVVFGPVFSTPGKGEPVGLESLRRACRHQTPVFALGGVTRENEHLCAAAGAAGIAAIRLFMNS
jgi:thiamine-phosphate pyrophosphorylase